MTIVAEPIINSPRLTPSASATGKIIEAHDVTVSFDGFKALNNLNFAMERGELRFVIGPNGAGKTTFLDVMTGKTRPQRGTVTFDAKTNVLRTAEHELVRRGIGRKFQTPTVFNSLTVYENLEAAAGFRDGTLGLFKDPAPETDDKVNSVLELVGLWERAFVRAGILSHGEKQWLEIGMLLMQEPKLLLLDEPVAGMTRRERDHTGELVQEVAKRCSVLVVEHDMEFVRNYANTVTVLHLGSVLTEGPVAQVQSDPEVIEVYIGRSRGE
ncbi:MAG TPA: urea ABC transporter ATP-binding protein UrtD [Caldilineaceae bacterium]|nr:urea ABC transporter ATP-binding protein UrtD [Caldilineaceae bacterium]